MTKKKYSGDGFFRDQYRCVVEGGESDGLDGWISYTTTTTRAPAVLINLALQILITRENSTASINLF